MRSTWYTIYLSCSRNRFRPQSSVPTLQILEELAKMQQDSVQDTKAASKGAVTETEVANAITAAARDREVNLRTSW